MKKRTNSSSNANTAANANAAANTNATANGKGNILKVIKGGITLLFFLEMIAAIIGLVAMVFAANNWLRVFVPWCKGNLIVGGSLVALWIVLTFTRLIAHLRYLDCRDKLKKIPANRRIKKGYATITVAIDPLCYQKYWQYKASMANRVENAIRGFLLDTVKLGISILQWLE